MVINKPYLFIEINDKHFIFLVVEFNDELNFKVLDTLIIKSAGVLEGKITDALAAIKIIKSNLHDIENKIKYVFKNITLVIAQNNFNSINISGYKKLRGEQILNEDISFILNDIKKIITDNNVDETLIHLFNSSFKLDNAELDVLPVGLYGNFYNQELSFFLLPKNDLKNLKLVINKCDISIERVILKSFAEGIHKIKKYNNVNMFSNISIGKNKSKVSIFNNSSFIYSENFSFGSNSIIKDISKLLALSDDFIQKLFTDKCFKNIMESSDNEYLDEKYFDDIGFRKISLSYINKIINARVEELIELIYKKNINLKYISDNTITIYLSFEDQNIFTNLKENFEAGFLNDKDKLVIEEKNKDDYLDSCLASAELIGKGWAKEAIPIVQHKKSLIAEIFAKIFN